MLRLSTILEAILTKLLVFNVSRPVTYNVFFFWDPVNSMGPTHLLPKLIPSISGTHLFVLKKYFPVCGFRKLIVYICFYSYFGCFMYLADVNTLLSNDV